MRKLLLAFASISFCALSALGFAQPGGMGGGMGQAVYQGDSTGRLEQELSLFVSENQISSVLTPGEFVEWKLPMKAGQVVIAEAKSDSFDPALELVNDSGKVVAFNDDRYPGDQRPLLLWHADKKGEYRLHVRSFRDKFGGQFNVDFKIYDCYDVGPGQKIDLSVDGLDRFLVRIPMKAGQIKELVSESPPGQNYWQFQAQAALGPDGLPDINLAAPFQKVTENFVLMAPVSGYYYAYSQGVGSGDKGRIRVSARDIPVRKLANAGVPESAIAETNEPTAWEIPVKKGQVLEISALDPNISALQVQPEEERDISKFDMSKDDKNPFFPRKTAPTEGLPLFRRLPGRPHDDAVHVLYANRTGKLLIALNAKAFKKAQFKLRLRPDTIAFPEGATTQKKLRIGDTDYWSIDASAGDVMSFESRTASFIQSVDVYDPSMEAIRQLQSDPNDPLETWRMVVQKPGRYLEAVSSVGNGGGGDYSVSRKVIHPKQFEISSPAESTIPANGIQAWRFSVQPSTPLLVHWKSTNWSFDVAVYDDKGNAANIQRQDVDAHNKFGILKVSKPQSFVLVLSGRGKSAAYSIDLSPIPGYGKGGSR